MMITRVKTRKEDWFSNPFDVIPTEEHQNTSICFKYRVQSLSAIYRSDCLKRYGMTHNPLNNVRSGYLCEICIDKFQISSCEYNKKQSVISKLIPLLPMPESPVCCFRFTIVTPNVNMYVAVYLVCDIRVFV